MTVARRARPLATLLAVAVTGAGLGACGGQTVSEKVPRAVPDITVPANDGLAAAASTTSTTATTTTATTPTATPAAPSSGTTGGGTATPTPTPAAPSTGGTTGGGTTGGTGTGGTGTTGGGSSGGAGYQDFCNQNPGAC